LHECFYREPDGGWLTWSANPTTGSWGSGTNASNVADTAADCGPGGGLEVEATQAIDLLGNRYLNLNNCFYRGAGGGVVMWSANRSMCNLAAVTKACNVPDTAADCGPGVGLEVEAPQAIDLPGNRYLNLNNCFYREPGRGWLTWSADHPDS